MAGDDEPRTVRAAREAIRDLEAAVERVHMSPAPALGRFTAGWYLRKARLALRQAERAFAVADDPRLEPLAPMRAQLSTTRRCYVDADGQPIPRRKRYRCPSCFRETLERPGEVGDCGRCGLALEPVARMRKT